ncbi:MAG: HAD family hydrolase [Candidatus Thorarchaeota archaeon]
MSKLELSKFEAVIFDLDSTLTNTQQYPFIASEWLLNKIGVESEELKESFLRNLFTRYMTAIQDIVEGASFRSASEIVHTSMMNSLEDIEQNADPRLVDEAAHRFKNLHLELSTLRDGVTDILVNLKTRGLKLGVITNSFAGNAKTILTNLELVHFFSSIIDCGEVNAFKPMKAPFERVLRDIDTEATKAIYVGDEYYADMVGAKSLGMTTAWINYRKRSLEDQVAKYGFATTPDFVLASITEFGELF